MDAEKLIQALEGLPLGPVRYYPSTGSTNEQAVRWAQAGAPDISLVVANEQTAGRGRLGKRWYTPAGAGLAFSLVLYPGLMNFENRKLGTIGTADGMKLMRHTALGALATCEALEKQYGIPAQIKWPNDVLVHQHKLAGVLTEATWEGDILKAIILGIGLNITQKSIQLETLLDYPATCLEDVLGKPVERVELTCSILENMLFWRARLNSLAFIHNWKGRLAFRGEWVHISYPDGTAQDGIIQDLTPEGFLRLKLSSGEFINIVGGEVHLRQGE